MQELEADPLVVAHAERDLAHVGVDGLAQVRDRVDERDLRGEERVRRVLDHLGRRGVGDEDRRVERSVQRGDAHRDGRVVAADDHSVRVQEVADRRSLAEELRVRRDPHLFDRGAGRREDPLDHARGADRHRRLVDHHGPRREHRRDLAGDVLDERKVGRSVVALRRGHAEEHELGDPRRVLRAEHEGEPARGETLGQDLRETVLEDRHLALREPIDPLGVDVRTGDPVPEVREADRGGQPDVPGADDGDVTHLFASLLPWTALSRYFGTWNP